MKRGQAAMEFLMTYGWAILVVLIALGALFYLGVFSPKVPNICIATAPIVCQDVKLGALGGKLIIFAGATGVNLIEYTPETAITINGASCTVTDDGDANTDGKADAMKSTMVQFKCRPSSLLEGEKFSGTVELSYSTPYSSLTHTSDVKFSGTVE